MGTLINFPTERRPASALLAEGHDASVIILPVIRIERYADAPNDSCEPHSSSPRGRRRKR